MPERPEKRSESCRWKKAALPDFGQLVELELCQRLKIRRTVNNLRFYES
jgi:hypothetical protein